MTQNRDEELLEMVVERLEPVAGHVCRWPTGARSE